MNKSFYGITLAQACEQARQNNVHKKQIGFALVVVYERDPPFVKVAVRSADGDVKLLALLRGLVGEYASKFFGG